MKRNVIWISILFFFSVTCTREDITENKEINALIVNTPYLPEPPAPKPPTQIGAKSIIVNENDISYACQEITYDYANNMEQVIAFNPNAGTLYPGSLVQGKYVRNGELVSIGSFSRQPITLTLDEYGLSSVVDNPTNASISNAVVNMITQNTIPTIAKITYKQSEAYSTEQGLLNLGIDYTWASGSISPSMGVSNSHLIHNVYIYFLQSYYTASINQPANPSDFFGADAKVTDLTNKISDVNPLCYISSVTYGRMLIAKISSTSTIQEMTAAIKASLGAVSGQLKYTESEVLKNSNYEVSVIGGNAEDAMAAATQGMSGIVQYINNGANFSINSLGTPISYVVKYASDNSTVKMGKALEYTVKDNCYFDPSTVQKFSIFIDNFYIRADCDAGILFNTGAGEFTYKIEIKDNDKIIKSIISNNILEKYDGQYLLLDAGPYELAISKQNNHKIVISGCLYEWDDDATVVTNLSWPNIEFSYPWATIADTVTTYYQQIDAGNSCGAKLEFNIKKIAQ